MLRACIFISCVVVIADCLNKSGNCDGCRNEYTRIKRAKYYPSSPFKFYNRPPFSPSIRGPFSYTPPPGYTANDVGPPTPTNPRPYKVSKRPANDGLGEEDLQNLFKYLSKKDLDKIVDFANEKERYSEKYRETSNKNNYDIFPDLGGNENLSIKDQIYESDRILNSPPRANDNRHYSSNNDNPNVRYNTNEFKGPIQNNQPYSQVPLDINDSKNEEQFSFLDSYIQKEIGNTGRNKNIIFTDSTMMQEERLPKPTNLRNDDHEISFTNDVVSVVRPETSYKIENFADLPLMGYENSKLHTVSSYSVPHYSVTSSDHRPIKPSSSFSSPFAPSSSLFTKPSSYNKIEVEPAPPASAAKEQSDAHLKAIKIWTHRSKGTAYTLHDDGTLTLEHPSRPKFHYN